MNFCCFQISLKWIWAEGSESQYGLKQVDKYSHPIIKVKQWKKNSKQKQVLLKIKIQLYEIIKDTFVQFG